MRNTSLIVTYDQFEEVSQFIGVSLVADHGPGHVVRAERQESFDTAFGKTRIYLLDDLLFLAEM